MQVHQCRYSCVKYAGRFRRHGVFIGTEILHTIVQAPLPVLLYFFQACRQRAFVNDTRMAYESFRYQIQYCLFQIIDGKSRRCRSGRHSSPGLSVIRVETVFATAGRAGFHENAGSFTDMLIKSVHSPIIAGSRGLHVVRIGEPAFVADNFQISICRKRAKLCSHLSFCRFHHGQRLCPEIIDRFYNAFGESRFGY